MINCFAKIWNKNVKVQTRLSKLCHSGNQAHQKSFFNTICMYFGDIANSFSTVDFFASVIKTPRFIIEGTKMHCYGVYNYGLCRTVRFSLSLSPDVFSFNDELHIFARNHFFARQYGVSFFFRHFLQK